MSERSELTGHAVSEHVGPPGLPVGLGVELDASTRQIGADLLVGGQPRRVLRLGPAGVRAWAQLRNGRVDSAAAGRLARRLTDVGLIHPRPGRQPCPPGVSVIVPVLDRAAALDRCLAALGREHPVVVVDDGSRDAGAIAAVTARHGARLVRRERTGGPAAARNDGLAAVDTGLIAFLDSDCIAPQGWLEDLVAHLDDPALAAVAPRIVPAPAPGQRGRYTQVRSALDLGRQPARVHPAGRVRYVPTAALLVRRSALTQVGGPSGIFDPALRYGEDVDLVWRLDAAGWRVRYDPSTRVEHCEPASWTGLLERRYRYGSSAAALAQRHPRAIAPLVVDPLSAAVVAALLARRPGMAAGAFAVATALEGRTRARAGVPDGSAAAVAARVGRTAVAVATFATQLFSPLLLAGAAHSRTRPAALALLLGPPAHRWTTCRPGGSWPAFAAAHVAEDVAYGSGVWAGCLATRSVRAVLPRWVATPVPWRRPGATPGTGGGGRLRGSSIRRRECRG